MVFTEQDAIQHSGHANIPRRRRLWFQVATETYARFKNRDLAIAQANRAVFRQVIKETARRAEPVQMRLF